MMLLYRNTPFGKEYLNSRWAGIDGFTSDKSQAQDYSEEEASQKMKQHLGLVKHEVATPLPWPAEIMAWKKRSWQQTVESFKERGLSLDGDFEPCAYDVERERREMEKQERHDYIDRHRGYKG